MSTLNMNPVDFIDTNEYKVTNDSGSVIYIGGSRDRSEYWGHPWQGTTDREAWAVARLLMMAGSNEQSVTGILTLEKKFAPPPVHRLAERSHVLYIADRFPRQQIWVRVAYGYGDSGWIGEPPGGITRKYVPLPYGTDSRYTSFLSPTSPSELLEFARTQAAVFWPSDQRRDTMLLSFVQHALTNLPEYFPKVLPPNLNDLIQSLRVSLISDETMELNSISQLSYQGLPGIHIYAPYPSWIEIADILSTKEK